MAGAAAAAAGSSSFIPSLASKAWMSLGVVVASAGAIIGWMIFFLEIVTLSSSAGAGVGAAGAGAGAAAEAGSTGVAVAGAGAGLVGEMVVGAAGVLPWAGAVPDMRSFTASAIMASSLFASVAWATAGAGAAGAAANWSI